MKSVGVCPQPVGAVYLLIRESAGRIPRRNPRSPPEGKTEEPQPVIDSGSLFHLHGPGSDNAEMKLRGCDAFEIRGVAEKGKNSRDVKW